MTLGAFAILLIGSLVWAFARRVECAPALSECEVGALGVGHEDRITQEPTARSTGASIDTAKPARAPAPRPGPSIDIVSTRVAELEAEVARLRGQLADANLTGRLLALDSTMVVAQVGYLLHNSVFLSNPELRAYALAQIRFEDLRRILLAEIKFRDDLAKSYSNATPEARVHEWPAHRDRVVTIFFAELYRVYLADNYF
jgi:hypothetical protein